MKPKCTFPLIALMFLMACQGEPSAENMILSILEDKGPALHQVLADPEKFEVQILYTQIDRDSANVPSFRTYDYRVDDTTYFYPASTVKFPAAVFSLEKIRNLGIEGLTAETPMLTDSVEEWQSPALEDSTAENGLPSVAHYAKKILLVSDNDAFNRLYEFLGQGPLNQSLKDRGISNTRLFHRLSIFLSPEQNRISNPIRFQEGDQMVYHQAAFANDNPIPTPAPNLRGKGYMRGGELKNEPMDFTVKNFFPLADQHEFLRQVIFPNSVNGVSSSLLPEDYQFLYQYMSQLPRESDWPSYDPTEYYDSYVKFFLFGDNKERMPDNIRIFNKVGVAYGTLTDNAYIVDFEKGVEFLLSATIFVNENQIFNDGIYEYDKIGFPFLAELGRAIYAYELKREKSNPPDLSRFRVTYDQ